MAMTKTAAPKTIALFIAFSSLLKLRQRKAARDVPDRAHGKLSPPRESEEEFGRWFG
jgi:hypothetical protein